MSSPSCHFPDTTFTASKDSSIRVDQSRKLTVRTSAATSGRQSILADNPIRLDVAGTYLWLATTTKEKAHQQKRSGRVQLGVTTLSKAEAGNGCAGVDMPGTAFDLTSGKISQYSDPSSDEEPKDYLPEPLARKAKRFGVIFTVHNAASRECSIRFCAGEYVGAATPFRVPTGADCAYLAACLWDEDAQVEVLAPGSAEFGKHFEKHNRLGAAAKALRERETLIQRFPAVTRETSLLPAVAASQFRPALVSKLDNCLATVMLTGPEGSGKSTLLGVIACTAAGERLAVMPRSTNKTVRTAASCLREKCSKYFNYVEAWTEADEGDLILLDGYQHQYGTKIFTAMGRGLVGDCELLPTEGTTPDEKDEYADKVKEICSRTADPARHICCIINCISEAQVRDGGAEVAAAVQRVLIDAKDQFRVGNTRDPVEVPVLTVITQADSMSEHALRKQRLDPGVKSLIELCHQRFGMAENTITVIGGFGNTANRNFASDEDNAYVQVLRHLMLRVAGAGELFARRFSDV